MRDKAVVFALALVARPRILEAFGPESCVASVRIGLDVLDAFGVSGKPVPVWLRVVNREFRDLDALPEVDRDAVIRAASKGSPGGPWAVDVNNPADDAQDGAGHVVIVVPSCGLMLDLAADQVTRRHKNLVVAEPVLWPLDDPAFLTTPGVVEQRVDAETGVLLRYERVASRRYTGSPNWTRRSDTVPNSPAVFRQVTRSIIRGIEGVLAASADR